MQNFRRELSEDGLKFKHEVDLMDPLRWLNKIKEDGKEESKRATRTTE